MSSETKTQKPDVERTKAVLDYQARSFDALVRFVGEVGPRNARWAGEESFASEPEWSEEITAARDRALIAAYSAIEKFALAVS